VWSKPNGLPESVTDRVRRSHEQVFHFVKQPRYYSAVDEVREADSARWWHDLAARHAEDRGVTSAPSRPAQRRDRHPQLGVNPLGKLPGSVWTIPTAPLTVPAHLGVDHFAAFPPELVRRIVLGWSPREVCTACGEGRRPVVDRSDQRRGQQRPSEDARPGGRWKRRQWAQWMEDEGGWRRRPPITGYACACPDTTAPATPGVVLDPFGGTGTTRSSRPCSAGAASP
jgi:hypothetical protein